MADFDSVRGVLKRFDPTEDRYISREFQKYAYDLALELRDEEHKAIYMRFAKTVPRHILERARAFVKDANTATPARLFMWKVKKLREELKIKNKQSLLSNSKNEKGKSTSQK